MLRTDDMRVRAFQNACRHRGVKVVEEAGRARTGSPARSMAGATASTARTQPSRGERRSPSTTSSRTTSTSSRCGPRCGAGARGSTSTTPPLRPNIRRARSARGRWSRCGLNGGRVPSSRELEARRRGVRRDVPRAADIPSSSSPRGTGCATVAVRCSCLHRRTSSTCAR